MAGEDDLGVYVVTVCRCGLLVRGESFLKGSAVYLWLDRPEDLRNRDSRLRRLLDLRLASGTLTTDARHGYRADHQQHL